MQEKKKKDKEKLCYLLREQLVKESNRWRKDKERSENIKVNKKKQGENRVIYLQNNLWRSNEKILWKGEEIKTLKKTKKQAKN